MNTLSAFKLISRCGCAAALSLAAMLGQAQTARPPGLKVIPQPAAAPSGFVTPVPPSAAPNPAGRVSQISAGLPASKETPADAGIATPKVMGAGAVASRPAGAAVDGYTAAQIAQSFKDADANRDGELTRAETQSLVILPFGFEEMDQNKDGVISRAEYEAAFVVR